MLLQQQKRSLRYWMVLMRINDRILYEDNHLIIVNKLPGELVQGDETGDRTLADDVKKYLKTAYNKPGNVYLGIPHRLDRPTSGIVVYCKTDKALSRMTALFRTSDVRKTYWAIVDRMPGKTEGELGVMLRITKASHRARREKERRSQSFHIKCSLLQITTTYWR